MIYDKTRAARMLRVVLDVTEGALDVATKPGGEMGLRMPAMEAEKTMRTFAAKCDVDAMYIYPSLASDDLLSYIGTQGVLLFGTSTPEPRPGGWVMTISPDTIKAIQTAWPSLSAGQGGINVQSPLGLADVDPGLLPAGKLALVQETLDKLVAGKILTQNP